MSRQDPGATTGAGVYPPLRPCTCGHLDAVHAHRPGRDPGACSRSGCRCRGFEPGANPEPGRCEVCGAAWDVLEAARRLS